MRSNLARGIQTGNYEKKINTNIDLNHLERTGKRPFITLLIWQKFGISDAIALNLNGGRSDQDL